MLYLPSYSPNRNLIERIWKFVKTESLRSTYYVNYDEFTTAIQQCLDNLSTRKYNLPLSIAIGEAMYKSILVPLDGSTFGEHALPLALSLARRAGASLTLLHVHTPLKAVYLEGAAFLDESVEADIKAQQREYLRLAAERLQSVAAVPVEIRLVEGEVAASIAAEAAAHGIDLVVMTTHGRGALGRFWLGSTTDELVRHLPMPILLARPHEQTPDLTREPGLKHILIALDGTTLAEQIIEPAVAIGELTDADYTLIRVVRPVIALDAPVEAVAATQTFQTMLSKVEAIQAQLQAEARQYLESVAERLRQRGLNVQTRVDVEQQPGVAIIEESRRPDVELIALETHGRRGLSRLFIGSVADKVIRGANVPVLVHRPVHR